MGCGVGCLSTHVFNYQTDWWVYGFWGDVKLDREEIGERYWREKERECVCVCVWPGIGARRFTNIRIHPGAEPELGRS